MHSSVQCKQERLGGQCLVARSSGQTQTILTNSISCGQWPVGKNQDKICKITQRRLQRERFAQYQLILVLGLRYLAGGPTRLCHVSLSLQILPALSTMLATRHFCQIIRGKSDVADRLLQALPSGNNGNRETATPRDLRSATALPNLGKWGEKQPFLPFHFDSVRENLFQIGRKRIHGTTVKWIP